MTRAAPAHVRGFALLAVLLVTSRCPAAPTESFRPEPAPPGVRVAPSELDGPVFTDPRGRTLYKWPLHTLRNGVAGDHLGVSECTDVPSKTSAGLMSPYPGGLVLPESDHHPSCTQMWPPFLADAHAKPLGKWTLIARADGRQQWAYTGLPVYTFFLDHRAGDVLGARSDKRALDSPVLRLPIGPSPDVPPGFAVKTMSTGRLLVTQEGMSVYYSDRDTLARPACTAECADTWIPLLGPESSRPHGDWSLVERSAGLRQWAYRKHLLYRYGLDGDAHLFKGSDVPGWHNVYTQSAPPPPSAFTVQDTSAGQVLADANGRTLYTFFCGDDGLDQLGCDHPDETQAYRIAICGGGDPERCVKTFPYVIAPANARSNSRTWSILLIDPQSGRFAKTGTPGALRVWGFRDRPVYTYAGDQLPGDINADAHGEFRGERNGFRAIWLRDDFFAWNQPGPG